MGTKVTATIYNNTNDAELVSPCTVDEYTRRMKMNGATMRESGDEMSE
jgi:hypothetical protein